jgi:PTH1 family peptidyl-tRNA hydrolase
MAIWQTGNNMQETKDKPHLIVGLGNPGDRFRDTRHNIGFACVDLLAKRWGIAVNDRRRTTVLGEGYRNGAPVVLAKPRTFMNLSGESVAYLMARFGSRPAELIIVYDEMALPLGRLRLRAQGSDAGHNGIKDIIRTLHTTAFPRLRIGIGPPDGGAGSVNHVLGRFSPEEQPAAEACVIRAADALECFLADGISIAMNRFNTDPQPPSENPATPGSPATPKPPAPDTAGA